VQPGESKTARPAAATVRTPAASAGPPESDPRDDEDYEPEAPAAATPAVDPEAEAMKLLTSELGARPLDSP
jgi:hypothetical protein